MKKIYSLLFAFLGFCLLANAQSQLGELRGKVIDAKTKKPMDFVSVSLFLNGILKATAITDDDGNYVIKTLQPGEYEIKVTSVGYRNSVITDVDIVSDVTTFQNINLESNENGTNLIEVTVIRKKPLVDPEGKGGGTVTAKEVMRLPQRNPNMIANTFAGVDARAGGTPNFRGARSDGTAYYVDGVRVNGQSGIPQGAIDQVTIITGGTPAQYGDFIGGAIAISTKSPSKIFQRFFEYRTSSPFYGYLDNSQSNELQAFIAGPIKIINKGKQNTERVLFGFSIAGTGTYTRDPRLSVTDLYQVKPEVLRQIEYQPLTKSATGGFVNSAEYLTQNDLQKIPYRQNVAQQNYNLSGSFTYSPANNINVKFGYQANYQSGRGAFNAANYSNSLLNSSNNALSTFVTVRPYVQFTQTFTKKTDEEAKKAFISNAFYTVRLSYERYYQESKSADYGEDFFNYGYIGKFSTYSTSTYDRIQKSFTTTGEPADRYGYKTKNGDSAYVYLTNYWKQRSTQTDTLTTFQQADINTVKGNYTRTIFDYYNKNNLPIRSLSEITQQGGLLNGYEPTGVYSYMWNNAGALQANYSKQMNETYSLYVMSEASVGTNPKARHDLQFGFTYEQQFQRGYSLNANTLWLLMRQLTNQQFTDSLSPDKAILNFNANGVFQDTVKFHPYIVEANQSNFDKNLRTQLMAQGATDVYGNPITNETKLDVNLYNPSTYSLKMFNADELLNNGNSYVNYYGYDYLGNRVDGKQSIDKFLQDKQLRPLGAFQPIYMAAWVQDKFVFKDLIVRLGMRMERYDANQQVLKDPYSLAPIYSVGDVKRNDALNLASSIPSNIGDGYAVYIDNEKQTQGQTHISGFRNGNDWFDANGNPVTDPQTLFKNSVANGSQISRNTPYLVNAGQKNPDAASFKNYTPDVKFLPRIWFSFPISTTAQFFGTYDVLAQRPTQGANIAQFDDYYYMSNRQGAVIGNPDLKMTQVTDFEIGFRQQIGDDASLGIIGSYREFRNLLQQYRYTQAWPYDYTTYGNIDFSTVKSVRLEYTLRELGNVNLTANYTLQFAEATGSNISSSASLIQSGLSQQRNIFPSNFDTRHILKGVFDYHYKEGKFYDGPIVGGKKIFENAGFNLIFNSSSGRPYTQIIQPITTAQDGVASRSQVKGTINGANLPSQFYTDINIDKYFTIKSESLEGKTTFYRLRIYLEIQNIFNADNVLSVYQYTGSAYSDGYLSSPQANAAIKSATSAQSFADLYNVKVVNPTNFALPRLTRLGISVTF